MEHAGKRIKLDLNNCSIEEIAIVIFKILKENFSGKSTIGYSAGQLTSILAFEFAPQWQSLNPPKTFGLDAVEIRGNQNVSDDFREKYYEAVNILRIQGLIMNDPTQHHDDFIVLTRRGKELSVEEFKRAIINDNQYKIQDDFKNKKNIVFNTPQRLPVTRNGIDYLFPFTVVDASLIGKPEEKSETRQHSIIVGISSTLCWVWALNDSDLIKVLFEYGKRHIENKMKLGELEIEEKLYLSTSNSLDKNSFDISRIPNPKGFSFEVLMADNETKRKKWDAFLSYASEDESTARLLYDRLTAKGLSVWYDKSILTIGDSLLKKIDEGLASSRFGIVILSHSFFMKDWPQKELDGLVQREIDGKKVILPIWHEITREEVAKYSPILVGRFAGKTQDIDELVKNLLQAMSTE